MANTKHTHLAQQQEIAALRAEIDRLSATPKCGRCGKRELPDFHTCTPTHWARGREAEIADLRAEVERLRGQVAIARETLEHYAKEDIRNARHYPPEFAKDALAKIKGDSK